MNAPTPPELPSSFIPQFKDAVEYYCDARREFVARNFGIPFLMDAAFEEDLEVGVMNGLSETETHRFYDDADDSVLDHLDTPAWDVMAGMDDADNYMGARASDLIGGERPIALSGIGLHRLTISYFNRPLGQQPSEFVLTSIGAKIENDKLQVHKDVQTTDLNPNLNPYDRITHTEEPVMPEDLKLIQRVIACLPRAVDEGYQGLEEDFNLLPPLE